MSLPNYLWREVLLPLILITTPICLIIQYGAAQEKSTLLIAEAIGNAIGTTLLIVIVSVLLAGIYLVLVRNKAQLRDFYERCILILWCLLMAIYYSYLIA